MCELAVLLLLLLACPFLLAACRLCGDLITMKLKHSTQRIKIHVVVLGQMLLQHLLHLVVLQPHLKLYVKEQLLLI